MRFAERRAAHDEAATSNDDRGDVIDIDQVEPRRRCTIEGRVVGMRATPAHATPSLSVTVQDQTGSVTVVWSGRPEIGGIGLGRHVRIDGVAALAGDRLVFTNPVYNLLP